MRDDRKFQQNKSHGYLDNWFFWTLEILQQAMWQIELRGSAAYKS